MRDIEKWTIEVEDRMRYYPYGDIREFAIILIHPQSEMKDDPLSNYPDEYTLTIL